MKKRILALVAVMACVMLASCGGPAKNPDDAVAALKENGYDTYKVDDTVFGEKDGEFIVIEYCSDKETAKKAYEEAEKEREEAKEKLAEAKTEVDKAKAELETVKDNALLKGAAEEILELAEKALETIEMYAECEIGQSGNMVWCGTAQAIKDAK